MLNAFVLSSALLTLAQTPTPAAAPAASTTQADVERLFAEGAALYRAGKYRPAVDKFEEAYALFPEPNLLYNMARAYEALGDVDQALLKYRLCVSHPRGTDELKTKAAAKVAVLAAAKENGANTVAPPSTMTSTPATTTVPTEPVAPPAAAPGLPIFGIAGGAAAGLGVVVGGIGGVVYAIGAGTHADLEKDLSRPDANGVLPITRAQADEAAAAGASQKSIGVGMLVGGGVLVAAAVPLFVVQFVGGE